MKRTPWLQWILLQSSSPAPSKVKEHDRGTSLTESQSLQSDKCCWVPKGDYSSSSLIFSDVKSTGKLHIKPSLRACASCSSLLLIKYESNKEEFPVLGKHLIVKAKLSDIRADEASAAAEMTTLWQLKTRWSCFLLTRTVTSLNYRACWSGLCWNVSLCLHRGSISQWSKSCCLQEQLPATC